MTSYEPEYYSTSPDDEGLVTVSQVEKKYTGGVAYYGITMMNDAENGTVNKYTVKRNQYWSVEINAVSGCGDSDDDDWKTGPDPDAETYMKATITVEDWDDVERPGGI